MNFDGFKKAKMVFKKRIGTGTPEIDTNGITYTYMFAILTKKKKIEILFNDFFEIFTNLLKKKKKYFELRS